MDKLKMHTPDRADENFRKLSELFPNAVTETIVGYDEQGKAIVERAIDKDALAQEISAQVVDGSQERYQFTWPDKRKSVVLANAPIAKTLRLDRAKSVGRDGTPGGIDSENVYIEGDNLDALKLLQETYLGKVKMIYIDPPYNTGNDYIFNDNFTQYPWEYMRNSGQLDDDGNRLAQNAESNGRFHTNWLNMIYPRLRIARDLLSDDGVILINMDEHEIENLQKVCVEIFGAHNNIGTIVWDKRNPKGDARGIAYQHEYIICFAKNIEAVLASTPIIRPKKNAQVILKKALELYAKKSPTYTMDDINSDFSKWMKTQTAFSGGERAYNKIDENGDVYRPVSMAWPNKKKAPADYFIPLIHPVTHKACPIPERGWRNPSATMRKLISEGKILFGKDESTIPNSKYLLKDNMFENIPSLLWRQ